ncbi:Alpha/Beta hydrolase protein [Halteromyces radiatus]|uniref:Alpha/Beta hydrolase protein n=1 Tax=Halteromyces radiatus TaxID=101107 RepID=UPI00221FB05F|nr:Alpha/Beta hydrolase protein [Halteromyces radiatus]KAI8099527.1 Alpha/Beta hydrolase protein [Halteromyces radiatus]
MAEYLTTTYIDTHHPLLPLYTYFYSPESSRRDKIKSIILLLHGAGGDHRQFDDVFPLLVQEGYQVMVCDIRYHGKSQPANDTLLDKPIFDFHVIIKDINRALTWYIKQQQQESELTFSLILGGLSMGGMIAQSYLYQHTNSLQATPNVKIHALLAFGCSNILISDPIIPWMIFYKDACFDDDNVQAIILSARKEIIDSAYQPLTKNQVHSALTLVSDKILFHCFCACANSFTFVSDKSLSNIRQLLIRGEYDLYTKEVMDAWYLKRRRLHGYMDVDYHVIPNTGHFVTMEAGKQVAQHVITFLSCKT